MIHNDMKNFAMGPGAAIVVVAAGICLTLFSQACTTTTSNQAGRKTMVQKKKPAEPSSAVAIPMESLMIKKPEKLESKGKAKVTPKCEEGKKDSLGATKAEDCTVEGSIDF